ncbi:MAG: methyltransferase domain-containing protein, partial [Chloroflexi bacterium]|nr:methyltransferase domain-containing protein [Chloroflexota bacterium]
QDAVALAALGCEVVAVEREPLLASHIRALAESGPALPLTVVEDDFYQVSLPAASFDAVVYWDGFGIGTDADQRRLLRRVRRWLKPEGWVFLEVYTPWHAARSAGHSMRVGEAVRTYAFDPEGCRWLDEWRRGEERVVQSLRCYSPADLRLLLEGTGLAWVGLEPGGRMDYITGRYEPQAPLAQAMSYTAILRVAKSLL